MPDPVWSRGSVGRYGVVISLSLYIHQFCRRVRWWGGWGRQSCVEWVCWVVVLGGWNGCYRYSKLDCHNSFRRRKEARPSCSSRVSPLISLAEEVGIWSVKVGERRCCGSEMECWMAGFFGQVLCVEVTGRCSVSEEGFGRGRRRFEFEGMIPTYARKTLHLQYNAHTKRDS